MEAWVEEKRAVSEGRVHPPQVIAWRKTSEPAASRSICGVGEGLPWAGPRWSARQQSMVSSRMFNGLIDITETSEALHHIPVYHELLILPAVFRAGLLRHGQVVFQDRVEGVCPANLPGDQVVLFTLILI